MKHLETGVTVLMDSKKLPRYRAKLEEIRASLIGDVEKNVKFSQEGLAEPVADITDGAAESYSRQLLLDLGEQDWLKLRTVEAALRKMESGDYGICSNCENPIPEGRLDVVPFAEYCVQCLDEIEKENELNNKNLPLD